jgi:hypothetical protein
MLLGGYSTQSFAQNLEFNSCRALFENTRTSKEKLELKLNTQLHVFLRLNDEDGGVRDYSIRITDDHKVYATGLFSYYEEIANIEIIQMKVYYAYKKLGLGSLMMEEILKALPETEVIIVNRLKDDNLKVVENFLIKGYSQIEALKKTPAYKIRAKFGFSEIITDSLNAKDGFAVRKPSLKD